jgi:hypothetical protein
MEPFFCAAGGKKLPGKHGQQDLIAALQTSPRLFNQLNLFKFSDWHGFRSNFSEPPRLGRADDGLKDPQTRLGRARVRID